MGVNMTHAQTWPNGCQISNSKDEHVPAFLNMKLKLKIVGAICK